METARNTLKTGTETQATGRDKHNNKAQDWGWNIGQGWRQWDQKEGLQDGGDRQDQRKTQDKQTKCEKQANNIKWHVIMQVT